MKSHVVQFHRVLEKRNIFCLIKGSDEPDTAASGNGNI